MSPIAQLPPHERSYPSSSSTLAKEGPKNFEELMTTAMKQLDISMFTPGDLCCEPMSFTTPTLGARTLSMPSPLPKDGSCVESAGMTPEQAADHNQSAFNAFADCDLWALQLNTIGSHLMTDRSPPGSIPTPGFTETTSTANGGSPQSPLTGIPTPSGPGAPLVGPSDFDFDLGNVLMSEDLDFFNSLTSMFENIQQTPAPTSSAPVATAPSCEPPPPQTQSATAPSVAPGEELGQTCTLSQLEMPPMAANSPPFALQGDASQDPRLWQWLSAPDGEL